MLNMRNDVGEINDNNNKNNKWFAVEIFQLNMVSFLSNKDVQLPTIQLRVSEWGQMQNFYF